MIKETTLASGVRSHRDDFTQLGDPFTHFLHNE